MRFTEIVSSIPFLPFAIILSTILGNKVSELGRIIIIMFILGVLSWPGIARLVRGSVLAEREQEFVTAAKALGVKEMGIVFRHIIPNVVTVIIVNATLDFATCMLTESSLSFIGFGVQEPSATWGNMLNAAQDGKVIQDYWWRWLFPSIALGACTISINCIGGVQEPSATWGNMLNAAQDGKVIQDYWWRWLFPSIALGACTISINCIGDGLRDAIDPKSKER